MDSKFSAKVEVNDLENSCLMQYPVLFNNLICYPSVYYFNPLCGKIYVFFSDYRFQLFTSLIIPKNYCYILLVEGKD